MKNLIFVLLVFTTQYTFAGAGDSGIVTDSQILCLVNKYLNQVDVLADKVAAAKNHNAWAEARNQLDALMHKERSLLLEIRKDGATDADYVRAALTYYPNESKECGIGI